MDIGRQHHPYTIAKGAKKQGFTTPIRAKNAEMGVITLDKKSVKPFSNISYSSQRRLDTTVGSGELALEQRGPDEIETGGNAEFAIEKGHPS
jgi:hypothetical protein